MAPPRAARPRPTPAATTEYALIIDSPSASPANATAPSAKKSKKNFFILISLS